MPAERFYIDAELIGTLELEGAELHHLAHVMRIQVKEIVELVNGRGALATAQVTALSRQRATLTVLRAVQTPPPLSSLTLAIPFMRLSKLEWVIEKGTELGAGGFWLYPAAHSEKGGLSPHQLERLSHLAIAAMKQCGRLDLPLLKIILAFEELFKAPSPHLFGDTREGAKPLSFHETGTLITGPEKGFSERELEILEKRGEAVSLHKNILRAETAPIVALIQATH